MVDSLDFDPQGVKLVFDQLALVLLACSGLGIQLGLSLTFLG